MFLDQILEYKKKAKLISTYYQPINKWIEYDGRVHTNYSLGKRRDEEGTGGTVTGRLSSNNPNLQNIPRGKEHRGMFGATNGFTILDGDFSQLELRVAAHLSQEPVMMDAFNNGLDIHSAVMSDLTGMPYDEIQAGKDTDEKIKNDRVAIKRVNFGILYGVQARRLQRLLRIELGINMELEYCQTLIKDWLRRYGKVAEWLQAQKIQAATYKYVTMPLGQKRRLPNASFDRTKEAAHALAQATNFPVQSLASWICLIGLTILDNYWEQQKQWMEAYTLMQVHDSVTSEIKLINSPYNLCTMESIKLEVSKIMEKETLNYLRDIFGVNFNVPLVFDTKVSERWS
jgi:DNA polymerase-1